MALRKIALGGRTIQVDDTIAERIAMANADFKRVTGKDIQVNQSFRTPAQQLALYNKLSKTGGRVAPPGTSFHEKGLAIDVTNNTEAQSYLNRYGLRNDLADDKGHFSFGETAKPKYQGITRIVEDLRRKGKTDSQILDSLAISKPEFAPRITSSRAKYGTDSQITNDRDLVNFLAIKFSGKMPTVASVPLPQQQATPEKQGFFSKVAGAIINSPKTKMDIQNNLNIGQLKKALQTVKGGSSLWERVWNSAKGKLGFDIGDDPTLFGVNADNQTEAEKLITPNLTTPINTTQKLGYIGQAIFEVVAPATMGVTGVTVGDAVTAKMAPGILKTGLGLLANASTEGFLAASNTAIQEGKLNKNVALSGKIGFAAPIVVYAGGKIINWTAKGMASALGKSTGTSSTVIKEAYENPNVVKYARQAGIDPASYQDDILDEARAGLNKIARQRSQAYVADLNKIKLNTTQLDDIANGVRDTTKNLLDDYKITVIPQDTVTGKLNVLNFDKSPIVKGKDVVQKAFNEVLEWTDNTPAGLDVLKKHLSMYVNQLSPLDAGPAKSMVLTMKSAVDGGLKANVAGYSKMVAGYTEASDLIDDITRSLSLGDKASKETAMRKLLLSMKDNNTLRQEFVRTLSNTLGEGHDIIGRIAGSELSQYTAKGIAGVLEPGVSLVGLLNPATWPHVITYLAMSSPKLVGEFVSILGKITPDMAQTGKYAPEILRALRVLILESVKKYPANTFNKLDTGSPSVEPSSSVDVQIASMARDTSGDSNLSTPVK